MEIRLMLIENSGKKKRLQQNQFDAFDFYKLLLPENSRQHILCKYQGTLTLNMTLWSTQQNTENLKEFISIKVYFLIPNGLN